MAFLHTWPEIASISTGSHGGFAVKLKKLNPTTRRSFRGITQEDPWRRKLDIGTEIRVFSRLKRIEFRISNSTCSCFAKLISSPEVEEIDQIVRGEVKRFSFVRDLWISWKYSAPVQSSSSPKHKEGGSDKQNYYVNTGYAIRTLREEFPAIFYKEPTFDIYREDIVFKDPINTFRGIDNYKLIFRALRFNGRIFFKALWVDIVAVWQPVENVIMIRWTVHGIPRVPWESYGRFDGISEYKLDKNGKIFEHRVDNVAFNTPLKFRILAVEELIQSLGCPSTPKPTYFEILPFLMQFKWVRYYLAFNLILAWKCAANT